MQAKAGLERVFTVDPVTADSTSVRELLRCRPEFFAGDIDGEAFEVRDDVAASPSIMHYAKHLRIAPPTRDASAGGGTPQPSARPRPRPLAHTTTAAAERGGKRSDYYGEESLRSKNAAFKLESITDISRFYAKFPITFQRYAARCGREADDYRLTLNC